MTERTPGRIVVGVDDSPGGRAALAYALREGAQRGADVEVVGAYAYPEYTPGWTIPGWSMSRSVEELRSAVQTQVEHLVAEAIAEVGEAQVAPVVKAHAAAGHPVAALLDAARDADLLVVGSRGHGGFASMMLGSVSQQCVQHAPCPVTVVPLRVAGGRGQADRSRTRKITQVSDQ